MKLPATTAALSGYTDVYKLTAEHITALGNGGTVQVAVLPQFGIVTKATIFNTTFFSGPNELVVRLKQPANGLEFVVATLPQEDAQPWHCNGSSFNAEGAGVTAEDVLLECNVHSSKNAVAGFSAEFPIIAEVEFTEAPVGGTLLLCLHISDPKILAEV